LINAINNALPEDIALQTIERCQKFHPRFDAVSRLYKYTLLLASQPQPLLRHRAWHIRKALDLAAMTEAAALLVGQHDFAALGKPPQGENTVRTVYSSEWQAAPHDYGALWTYTVEADAFLQHMVRRIVGALVIIGQGRMSVETFAAVLQAKRLLKVALAPPHGLVLARVKYQDHTASR
jgi:tRNA pseudouridine38-40 synthase